MTCQELNEQLPALVEGGLGPQVEAVLYAHAAECDCCRELVKTYRDTVELGAELRVATLPPGICDAMEAMLARLG